MGGVEVFLVEIGLEAEGTDGANVGECFGEDGVDDTAGCVGAVLPAGAGAFEEANHEVHEWGAGQTDEGKSPGKDHAPEDGH